MITIDQIFAGLSPLRQKKGVSDEQYARDQTLRLVFGLSCALLFICLSVVVNIAIDQAHVDLPAAVTSSYLCTPDDPCTVISDPDLPMGSMSRMASEMGFPPNQDTPEPGW